MFCLLHPSKVNSTCIPVTTRSHTDLCFAPSDYNNISKFLNRILGVEVTLQNLLFR